ncbi:MAG: hypothetical protein WDZ29_04970 [Balneolaceae bacterium]
MKVIADTLFKGNKSALARELEMKPQALAKYLKGQSMPGGHILIRLHDIGVNINWFLTGLGELLHRRTGGVAEPDEHYLEGPRKDDLTVDEVQILEKLDRFSRSLQEMALSPALQQSLLLVFLRHIHQETDEAE